MISDDIRRIVQKRVKIDSHDSYGTEECWCEEVRVLTQNIECTLHFFEYECTNEELYWLSEVFTAVSDVLQNRTFVDVLRKRLSSVTKENYVQSDLADDFMRQIITYDDFVDDISIEIDYAEGALND